MKLEQIQNKIKIFCDGPNLHEINSDLSVKLDGYTFNPSLFKKNKADDYLAYSKMLLKECGDKPVSLEVIGDEKNKMIEQGIKLANLKNNVYVKVPIIFTNGDSTKDIILELVKSKIKLNITAIFTLEQIKNILPIIENTETILSVFVGRIYDSGVDGGQIIEEINSYVHKNSKCKTLWASTRMSFDIVKAIQTKSDIITMQIEQIRKLNKFGKNLVEYSKETVNQFYNDAKSSGYEF
tara:strand:+ start:1222 stop:1935 length:714 start_codon:yes stop_codon:yes gene_type:complete